MFHIASRFPALLSPVLLTGMMTIVASATAQVPPAPPLLETPSAQANYADCQPPSPGEYLLLVVSKTAESQEQVRRTVPPNTTVTVCHYLSDVVTRVGGFTTADTANAWAKYMQESIGLSAFVARPSEVAAQPAPTSTQISPAPTTTKTGRSPAQTPQVQPARGYNPQVLGGGYAVLVDYFSKPELATQVQQLVGKEIGLVSYRQRPFLLAVHTNDQSVANSTLQALTDRGFWAMVVDSRRVTLLRQAISTSPPTVKK